MPYFKNKYLCTDYLSALTSNTKFFNPLSNSIKNQVLNTGAVNTTNSNTGAVNTTNSNTGAVNTTNSNTGAVNTTNSNTGAVLIVT